MRRASLPLHETLMLLAAGVLGAWRLTGLPAHEWLGLVMAAAVLVHLLRQWTWIASTTRTLVAAGRQPALSTGLLNAGRFIAFAATGISGVRISKFAVRARELPPAEFLKWQGLHGAAAQAFLILVGLHLALNWNRLMRVAAFGRGRPGTAAMPAATGPAVGARGILRAASRAVARVAIVVIAAGVVNLGVVGLERSLPDEDVVIETRDGRITHAAPTAELTRLRDEERAPDPARGLVQLGARAAVVGLAALAGRRVLRLRLGG